MPYSTTIPQAMKDTFAVHAKGEFDLITTIASAMEVSWQAALDEYYRILRTEADEAMKRIAARRASKNYDREARGGPSWR